MPPFGGTTNAPLSTGSVPVEGGWQLGNGRARATPGSWKAKSGMFPARILLPVPNGTKCKWQRHPWEIQTANQGLDGQGTRM